MYCPHIVIAEVQTYFIRLNVSEELGCDDFDNDDFDDEKCYVFSKLVYKRRLSNPRTVPFRNMKLRLQSLGVSKGRNE